MTTAPPPADDPYAPRFTSGSTMRHVVVMATTGAVGMMALFLVDLANLLYISLLGDPRLTAAIGFATVVIFFFISLCVGLMIGGTALVARSLGAGDPARARRFAGSSLAVIVVVTVVLSFAVLPFAGSVLALIGAEGVAYDTGVFYLSVVLPTTPLMGAFMMSGGILRAVGDARRAMILTLVFGLTTAVLDPLFIFGFGLGVKGAAIVAVISRVVTVAYGFYVVIGIHRMVARPKLASVFGDLRPLMAIAGPAVLTNIANPVGNGYVTAAIAEFGDAAVAGWSIIARLIPVAFAALFSLSGAIGPIIGQNYGARRYDRVRGAIGDSLKFSTVYLLAIGAILFLARNGIVHAFALEGDAADLVLVFCAGFAIIYGFMAGLFVANAAFNNLGYPLLSTLFNWARATLGTVPFVLVGAAYGGAEGVIAAYSIGSVPFGVVAVLACYRIIRMIAEREPEPTATIGIGPPEAAVTNPAGRP